MEIRPAPAASKDEHRLAFISSKRAISHSVIAVQSSSKKTLQIGHGQNPSTQHRVGYGRGKCNLA